MKIFQISPYFIPYSGGQERYVYGLSKYLIKLGNEVVVATSRYPRFLGKWTKLDNIPVFRFDISLRIMRNPITFFPIKMKVKKIIKTSDIVHIHNEHAFTSFATALYKKFTSFNLVLTTHGILKFGSLIPNIIEKIYSVSLGKFVFKTSDAIVTNSSYDKQYVKQIMGIQKSDRVYTLHNAIDKEYWENIQEEKISEFSKVNGIKFLFVGRLIKRKGVHILIRAFYRFLKLYRKNAFLFLVGTGEDKKIITETIQKLGIEKYVKLLGEIPDSQLVYAYKNSDVLILPSFSEVCSTTILESLFFELPVITTNIKGNYEYFRNVAYMIPPGNPENLSLMMINVVKNYDKAVRKTKKGKKMVVKKFTWKHVAKEYLKIYKGLI